MPATIRLQRGVSRYFVGEWDDVIGFFETGLARQEARESRPQVQAATQPVGQAITASAELPGSTHYLPPPVPVGDPQSGGAPPGGILHTEGESIPGLGVPWWGSSAGDERQPSVIYSPPPIVLPGQVDPGREEQESEEGPMAHTWLHLGSQVLGGLFPQTTGLYNEPQGFVAGPGQVQPVGPVGPVITGPGVIEGANVAYSGGTCPPRKTRTLTIDCATGQEIKRKRRRRRALLTQGDMGVLFQIASLPNNANVRVALAGAIRR